jgi:hypothetical protein
MRNPQVSGERLRASLMELAKIDATPKGGDVARRAGGVAKSPRRR